ncbi:hypothetical protein PUNSTDRAFT_85214 [Punctularia strigosozonata HHB-11173 SS5]|uniref:uncharacterized protein n=1 Tax=Punctularia strigosozonata (strain HHB-11173) TaxID=741275 RepID=UPI00044179A7|nr:uncharacterized protein PUNSTDRAFT_85214 [Punctularia strigosozonata HHB-11173 SS5]EIN10839.1 hypothetical protein PUNSTDRAFT_85214 [Punctularia strigosozonata HHB-11173 SS5]
MLSFHLLATTVALLPAFVFSATPQQLQVSIPKTLGNNVVHPNFLGLSIELSFINLYFGNDTSSIPQPIRNYLSAIKVRTGSSLPVRIRLGGNSMDSSTYVPDQSTMLVFTDPTANFNDQPVNFGPVLYDVMKQVSDDVDGISYVVGLSLLESNDSRAPNVPVMAGAAVQILGDRIDSFLLGNEPDLYTGHRKRPNLANYTVQDYMGEFQASSNLLKNTSGGNVVSLDNIGGPTICCAWDLATLIEQGWLQQFTGELKYVSLQHYPQNNCFGSYQYQLDYYLKHSEVVTLAQWNGQGIGMANTNGKQVMMSEFNSASCGGIPGISDTFGAALWTVDYALQMALQGFSVAYIHSREAGISYNLFDPPMPAGGPGAWNTNPGWYALLAVPEILQSPNGTKVVDLDLANSTLDATATVAGYAAMDANTSNVHRLAIFNYANDSSVEQINLPAGIFAHAPSPANITVKYLAAPNANEKWNISWDGLTYNGVGDGEAVPGLSVASNSATTQLDCSQGCTVQVHGPGLAVVYVGDSVVLNQASNGTSSGTSQGSDKKSSALGLFDISSRWIMLAVVCSVFVLL